jgi:hypothetical protein
VAALVRPRAASVASKGSGGEVANALVCKTSIRGFNSRPELQSKSPVAEARASLGLVHFDREGYRINGRRSFQRLDRQK